MKLDSASSFRTNNKNLFESTASFSALSRQNNNGVLGNFQINENKALKEKDSVIVELEKAGKETSVRDVIKSTSKQFEVDATASPTARLIGEFSDITKDLKKITKALNSNKISEEERKSLNQQLYSAQEAFKGLQERAKEYSDSILGPEDETSIAPTKDITGVDQRLIKAANLLRDISKLSPDNVVDENGETSIVFNPKDDTAAKKLIGRGYGSAGISNDTLGGLLKESVDELKQYFVDNKKIAYDTNIFDILKTSDQLSLDQDKSSLSDKKIDLKKQSIRV